MEFHSHKRTFMVAVAGLQIVIKHVNESPPPPAPGGIYVHGLFFCLHHLILHAIQMLLSFPFLD
jgi:hypothetical protein